MPDDAIVIAEGGDKTEVTDMNIPDTTLDVARTMMGVPDVTPTPTKPTEPKVEEPVKKEQPSEKIEPESPVEEKTEEPKEVVDEKTDEKPSEEDKKEEENDTIWE